MHITSNISPVGLLLRQRVIFHAFAVVCFFFETIVFVFNHSFRNTIRVSNGLNPDQDRRFVSPDLGPNRLQRFSVDVPSRR